jgi:hypothetical protein
MIIETKKTFFVKMISIILNDKKILPFNEFMILSYFLYIRLKIELFKIYIR